MAVTGIGSTPASTIMTNYQQIIQNAPPIKIELPNTPPAVSSQESNGNISIHV
ncbi:MAG: hypothetical protein M0034_02705 [Deltaproteobacteria bacterium]|jgi:hypothetical protein|nr:hypothetical protein [Deltaproteobacteria bacterium]